MNKSVIAVGVFNSGLLSKYRASADATYNYETAPAELIKRANDIADVCEEFGTTLPAAAVAFPLGHPAVVNVTLGMRTAEQVQRNVDLYRAGVPQQVLARAAGTWSLLRTDAPVPGGNPAS